MFDLSELATVDFKRSLLCAYEDRDNIIIFHINRKMGGINYEISHIFCIHFGVCFIFNFLFYLIALGQ